MMKSNSPNINTSTRDESHNSDLHRVQDAIDLARKGQLSTAWTLLKNETRVNPDNESAWIELLNLTRDPNLKISLAKEWVTYAPYLPVSIHHLKRAVKEKRQQIIATLTAIATLLILIVTITVILINRDIARYGFVPEDLGNLMEKQIIDKQAVLDLTNKARANLEQDYRSNLTSDGTTITRALYEYWRDARLVEFRGYTDLRVPPGSLNEIAAGNLTVILTYDGQALSADLPDGKSRRFLDVVYTIDFNPATGQITPVAMVSYTESTDPLITEAQCSLCSDLATSNADAPPDWGICSEPWKQITDAKRAGTGSSLLRPCTVIRP